MSNGLTDRLAGYTYNRREMNLLNSRSQSTELATAPQRTILHLMLDQLERDNT
jgi:hypothetical protein